MTKQLIPVYFNWSGGKDSTLALHHILASGQYDVRYLLTTVNAVHQRVSMHGVRRELMHEQAKSLGIPLKEVLLPDSPDMSAYEEAMQKAIDSMKAEGIYQCVFGDIFLEDLRAYREQKLSETGVTAIFPLWKRSTTELAHEFIDLGYKTILVCTKADLLDERFVGRTFTRELIADLPENVDPCGENGEFHTFAFDGPIFQFPVAFTPAEKVYRTYSAPSSNDDDVCISDGHYGFHYIELLADI